MIAIATPDQFDSNMAIVANAQHLSQHGSRISERAAAHREQQTPRHYASEFAEAGSHDWILTPSVTVCHYELGRLLAWLALLSAVLPDSSV